MILNENSAEFRQRSHSQHLRLDEVLSEWGMPASQERGTGAPAVEQRAFRCSSSTCKNASTTRGSN